MLSIHNLCKTYASGTVALSDVSLTVQKGEFVALLGPNGAGKTTTINILVGNTEKTGGTVMVHGFDLDKDPLRVKESLGVVSQEVSFDGFFTVNEVLRNQSGYFGVQKNQEYIDELLQELGLWDKKHTLTRWLSGGMKRRVLIAKALVHKPPLFILDEPTAGVDIELRQSLYSYLERIHAQGTTIILTTHYLEEAERLCDRIVVINKGKVIADQPKNELLADFRQQGTTLRVYFETDVSLISQSMKDIDHTVEEQCIVFTLPKVCVPDVLCRVKKEGFTYLDFDISEPRLEDVFVHLVHS